MNTISDYISISTAERIKSIYLSRLDELSDVKKQHFTARLSVCDTGTDVTGIESVRIEAEEISSLIKTKQYRKCIREYTERPYKSNKTKEETLRFIESLRDEESEYYLCCSELLSRAAILHRMGLELPDTSDILNTLRIMMYHYEDPHNMWEHLGTVYVNTVGTLREMFDNIDIERLWNHTVSKYTENYSASETYAYGLTHTIINLSKFYTEKIDLRHNRDVADQFTKLWNDMYRTGLERYSKDIVAEMGVCSKLLGSGAWRQAASYLTPLVDTETGILINNNSEPLLERNEHTNILYIMLNMM